MQLLPPHQRGSGEPQAEPAMLIMRPSRIFSQNQKDAVADPGASAFGAHGEGNAFMDDDGLERGNHRAACP